MGELTCHGKWKCVILFTKGFSPMEYEGNDADAVFFWEQIRSIHLGIVYDLYMLYDDRVKACMPLRAKTCPCY